MKEILEQALSVGRGMWKHRWPALLLAWIVAAVGSVAVFRLPDMYEANARIYVDTASILKPLMAGLAVQPNIQQQVSMLGRTLITRPNVEKLVRMSDLDLDIKSQEDRAALVEDLLTRIRIGSTGRDNMYNLSFRDNDPEKAKRLIQSLVSVFVESGLGDSRRDTDSAKAFLDQQIRSYEQQLEEAQAKINAFKLRNLEMQSTDGRDSASRVLALREAVTQAQLQVREAENARDAMREQLAEQEKLDKTRVEASVPEESAIPVATPEIDARIAAQKRNLDNLLTRFTEQHPDVVITRRLIKDLEDQKVAEVEQLRRAARAAQQNAAPGVSANPVVQELQRAVASAEVQVSTAKARLAEHVARLNRAADSLKQAPAIEAEGAQLTREYNLIKSNYDNLIARRQSAEMSGRLEEAAGLVDFRLIEPPRVAPKPVSPNRLALIAGVMLASLGAGLFLAFAMSQLRPVIFGAADLRHKTGLPVLGVVSMLVSPAEVRRGRMDLARFALASGVLVGIFVAGMIAMTMMAG